MCIRDRTDSFGFAGEQLDTTGLLHLRARQYNPSVGRFTTVDPVQPGAPGTTGYNLYTYAANNPTTFTDPSGRTTVIETGVLNDNATRRAATITAFNAGRQRALDELARQAATRQLMQQIRRQLLAEAGTRVLETVVVSVGGSNEEGLTPGTVVDATGQLDSPLDTEAVPNPNPGSTSTGTSAGECQDLGPGGPPIYGDYEVREWDGQQRQFATGASIILTPDWLEQNSRRSSANPDVVPPGIPSAGFERGHLIAAVLGGSNRDGRNFVSLERFTNSPVMRGYELQVRNTVRSCDVVDYTVLANFDYAVPQPLESLDLLAISETAGVIVDENITNDR